MMMCDDSLLFFFNTKLPRLDSLFEAASPSNAAAKNRVERDFKDCKSWEWHLEKENETSLLEKTPALGLDYIYTVEYPEDASSEDIAHLSANMEYSNLPERALCRLVIGPTNLHVDADFVKRLAILQKICAEFGPNGPDPGSQHPTKLEIPSKEEIDSLENNNPCRVYQVTVLHPLLNFYSGETRLEAGMRCLDASLQTPMYPLRNVKVTTYLLNLLNFCQISKIKQGRPKKHVLDKKKLI